MCSRRHPCVKCRFQHDLHGLVHNIVCLGNCSRLLSTSPSGAGSARALWFSDPLSPWKRGGGWEACKVSRKRSLNNNSHTRIRTAHTHTHTHTRTRTHARTHTRTHAHARTHTCTHTRTHTHANTHARTHARTHTLERKKFYVATVHS